MTLNIISGFIKGWAPCKLTGCEDSFARLLSASLQLKIFKISQAFHKLCLGAKSKCPPAPNLNETLNYKAISFMSQVAHGAGAYLRFL